MRLDKFLKLSRLVKRRTIAKTLCDAGRVQLDERPAKPSDDVAVGQVVTIRYGNRLVRARIEKIPPCDTVPIQEAPSLYTLLAVVSLGGGGPSGDGPVVA
jgi:ribosomal 50S subunit-recycling heat shock protein